jgi:curved DNA-binding protein CbpA
VTEDSEYSAIASSDEMYHSVNDTTNGENPGRCLFTLGGVSAQCPVTLYLIRCCPDINSHFPLRFSVPWNQSRYHSRMGGCTDCCASPEEQVLGSAPQHTLLSLPRVIGSVASPVASKDAPVNPYEILQIRRDATPLEIKQSFKRLALFNHPGREASSPEGRLRRWHSFNLLGACYETLMDPDSRRRYDTICREIEQVKLQAGVKGALFVGGKPLRASTFDDESAGDRTCSKGGFSLLLFNNGRSEPNLPPLSRTSSESSVTEGERDMPVLNHEESCCAISQERSSYTSPSRKTSRSIPAATITTKGTSEGNSVGPPSLVDAASSEEEEEAEAHFSESTTSRLFGGPFSTLFKARNFEPFSDPYDIFEEAFGSQPFPRVSRNDIPCTDDAVASVRAGPVSPFSPPTTPRSPSGWRGEKHISADGKTTTYTMSRIVQDRRMTRTETVTRAPDGSIKTQVSVTAELLTPSNDEADDQPKHPFLVCFRPTVVDDQSSKRGVCDDVCNFYEDIAQQLDFTRDEFLEEWRRILSYNVSLNFTNSV